MKNKFILSIAAFVFSIANAAHAVPLVDASFTTSGSAGNWIADFTLINNLEGDNKLYFFGVDAPGATIVGSPTEAGWAPSVFDTPYLVNTTFYNKSWCCNLANPLSPREAQNGFKLKFSTVAAPTDVSYFAYAYFGNLGNPVFQGVAHNLTPQESEVPEPATLAMIGLGAGLLGFSSRRKRRA